MYLFALFLVIYEFTAYSANDMIMPGMIQVVKYFNVPVYYVALSFSFYVLGNCAFLLTAGYLAERFGKAKIIIAGNILFLLFTILIIYSITIHQFLLWRFLQGIGLCIIAIGYALIHEKFNDKTAIKLQSLMANVSLLAPLIGPALGSLIVSFFTWQYIFWVTACLAVLTLIGLFQFTPRDQKYKATITVPEVMKNYVQILKNKQFFLGMLCSTLLIMPLVVWISEAPNFILYKLKLGYTQYVIYQIISIGGLTISSIAMQFVVGRFRMYTIVMLGSILVLIGSIITLFGSNNIAIISAGLFMNALGLGFANGCLWRLVMTIKGYPHAMLASMGGFVQTLFMAVGVTIVNEVISYYQFSFASFIFSIFIFGFAAFVLTTFYISDYRDRSWL